MSFQLTESVTTTTLHQPTALTLHETYCSVLAWQLGAELTGTSLRLFSTPLLLVIIVALAFTACAPSEPWKVNNPELALRGFLSALAFRDHEIVWEFLDDDSREALAQQQQAADDENWTYDFDALEHLYSVWVPSAFFIDHLETTEENDDSATVVIHSIYGSQVPVTLTKSGERWTIALLAPTDPQVEGVDH